MKVFEERRFGKAYPAAKSRLFSASLAQSDAALGRRRVARARRLLAASFSTLAKQPFLFGAKPTLADAALHGQTLMLHEAAPALVTELSPVLAEHGERMRAWLAR